MSKKINKFNGLFLIPILGLFLLAYLTLHDLATAQGIGLYLALQQGQEERERFDLMVDIVGMLLLVAVLVIPCIVLKHKKLDALLRIMTVYFAILPSISMGTLVHLFDGHHLWTVSFDWVINLNILCSFLQLIIPLLVVLGYFYKKKGFTVQKWQVCILCSLIILVAGVLFLPELSEVLLQLCYYLLLLVAFDWWERLYTRTELYEKVILWLLFGVFGCRGCLRMLELMSAYQL